MFRGFQIKVTPTFEVSSPRSKTFCRKLKLNKTVYLKIMTDWTVSLVFATVYLYTVRDERGRWKLYKAQKTSAPTGDISIHPPDAASLENLSGNNAVELENKLRNFQNNIQSGEEGQMEYNPLDSPRFKPIFYWL